MNFQFTTQAEYMHCLMTMRKLNPSRLWGVVAPLSGVFGLHVPTGVRFCLSPSGGGWSELCGVFREHGFYSDGSRRFAEVVAKLAIDQGRAGLELSCFTPLDKYWAAGGFVERTRADWDSQQRPSLWLPEYGTPDVVYMRKDLG